MGILAILQERLAAIVGGDGYVLRIGNRKGVAFGNDIAVLLQVDVSEAYIARYLLRVDPLDVANVLAEVADCLCLDSAKLCIGNDGAILFAVLRHLHLEGAAAEAVALDVE